MICPQISSPFLQSHLGLLVLSRPSEMCSCFGQRFHRYSPATLVLSLPHRRSYHSTSLYDWNALRSSQFVLVANSASSVSLTNSLTSQPGLLAARAVCERAPCC
jgi:hypothetical protein